MIPPERAQRVLIYGVCGSGKTTFARRLGEKTGIPWHSADDLAFEADWKETSQEFQAEKVRAICEATEWILDTAYGSWLHIPFGKADLILGLDYPRWLSFGRLLMRTIGRVIDGRPVCNGNRESLRTTFSRDSILIWHFRSFRRKRERMRAWAEQGDPRVILFRTPREAERWLRREAQAAVGVPLGARRP
jgi:adenylate kinase family enzyme